MAVPQRKQRQLWDQFKDKQDAAARDALIMLYAPWVKYLAGRLAIGLGGRVEIDELVNCGIIGLIEAMEKYDVTRGIKFETYALSRIKGAMLDGTRLMDWVPHSLRQKANQLEKTYAQLEMKLGRTATDEEVAEALNLSLSQFQQLLAEVSCISVISLDEPVSEEKVTPVLDLVPDQTVPEPLLQVEFAETKQYLAEAIGKLPEKEKMVIALYYYEGLTLKEISLVLGLTESRVSQLHTKAIFRLRGHLGRAKKMILGE